MMRGYAADAQVWIRRGLQRAAISGGDSFLTEGHTYRCYAGPVLAAVGRSTEGRQHMSEFRELIQPTPDDRWRWGQLLAHELLFLVATGELGAPFEEAAERHARMRLSPAKLPLQLRHGYVALARGRLTLYRAAPEREHSAARRRFVEAYRRLRRAPSHPTLRAHELVIEAELHAFEARPRKDRERLARALGLAHDTDNPWVEFEASRLLPPLHDAAGRKREAAEAWERASRLLDEHRWATRRLTGASP